MKILIVKTIFIPTEEFKTKNYDSIISLFVCINSLFGVYPDDRETRISLSFNVHLCGWVNTDLCNTVNHDICNLVDIITNTNNNITYSVDIFDKNYGKIYTIKNMTGYANYDLCIYSDHDIIFADSFTIYLYSFIFRNIYPINEKYKLISLHQQGDTRHNPIIFNKTIVINKIRYHYSDNNIHIASGCFITDSVTFDMIVRLLPDTEYIYGNEDILIGELLNNYKLIHLVAADYHIFHPFDIDIDYKNWKKEHIFKYLLEKNLTKI